jgi:hypothetical protein
MATNRAEIFPFFVTVAMLSRTYGQVELGPTTDITIPEDDQVWAQGSEKQYYRVWVNRNTTGGYFIDKRFSDFYALYEELQKLLPGQEVFDDAPFPSKWKFWETAFEHRRPALESWLQHAMKKLPEKREMDGDLMTFLDTIGGAAAAASGISMPTHDHRPCSWTHFHGILVRKESGESYTIFRRYNMFLELKNKLGSAAATMAGHVVFPVAEANPIFKDVDLRRRGLERWLQEVVKSPNRQLHWRADIDKFLDHDDAKRGYLQCIADMAGAKVEDLIFDQPGCGRCEKTEHYDM